MEEKETEKRKKGGGGEFVLILSSHLILPSPGPLSSFHSSMSSMFRQLCAADIYAYMVK